MKSFQPLQILPASFTIPIQIMIESNNKWNYTIRCFRKKSPSSPSNQTALLNSPYTELVGLPLIGCLIIICGTSWQWRSRGNIGKEKWWKRMAARIYYEENTKLIESNVKKSLIFFLNFYISFCDRNCLSNLFSPSENTAFCSITWC